MCISHNVASLEIYIKKESISCFQASIIPLLQQILNKMVLMKCLVRLKGIIIRELRDAKGRRRLNRARVTMHETNEKLSKAMVILKKKQIGALEISLIRPKATAEVSVTDVVSRQKAGLHGVFWNISVTHTHGSESGRQY